MSDALFLDPDLAAPLPAVGETVRLGGTEGRHAAVVRRLRTDELIMIADGHGRGVRGRVTAVDRDGISLTVTDQLLLSPPAVEIMAVQALAKGDRAELAVEMLTEVGVSEIVPWQAARSIVRWSGDRAEKSRQKWQSAAREATKQSRRLRMPTVSEPVDTARLVALVRQADLTLILHEEAQLGLSDVPVVLEGRVLVIIGPEGGIEPTELNRLVEAGGRPVIISDGVLRTSTAGVVAVSMLRLLASRR